jgi:hypothetical protein
MFYGTGNNNFKTDAENNTETNLKNKLNNAFNDLDLLKKELLNIRGNNENLFPQFNYKDNKKPPLDKRGYSQEFFSDERYQNVINKNKESNKDNNKDKFTSDQNPNNSKEKNKYITIIPNTKNKNTQNNFYGKFKYINLINK